MDEKKRQYIEFVLNRNRSGINFPHEVGMVCDLLEPEVARGHFVAEPKMCNPLGIAHGGTYYTLMDQLAGMLVAANGRVGVTLQSSVNYLRAAKMGETVLCEAKPVHLGRSTGLVEARCYDQSGRTQATGTFQFFLKGTMDENMKANI